jgi:hypothetical protein
MSREAPKPATTSPSSDLRATKRHWLEIVSVVLGVIGLITSWLLFGIVFGIAAVVTGIVARSRVARGKAGSPAVAVVGIVLGALATIAGIAAFWIYESLSHEQMAHYHQCLEDGAWTHC